MATNDSNPGWANSDRALVRTVTELLEAGEYERLAELLDRVRMACEQEGDALPAHTLDLARRICLACNQSQAEAEWHQQARTEAAQREYKLRRQLNTLLDLAGGPDRVTGAPALPEPVGPLSLRQRLQDLLRRPGPQPPARVPSEAPAQPVEVTAPPPQEPEHAVPPVAAVETEGEEEPGPPSLVVYCLGAFRVYQDERPVDDWPSSKGKAIFKYLVTHRERPVVKEVLMEVFWPGAHPDAARNSLNVAIYGLRQALRKGRPSFSHVLYQDDCYLLNPGLHIWTDAEEFVKHCQLAQQIEERGDQAAALREYHAAEALYDGEFMEEDRYEDWVFPQRHWYQSEYLKLLDCLGRCCFDKGDYAACVTMCRKVLAIDPCREEAHRRLMRCYSQQGQTYLALRQYHLCVEMLKEELEITPSPATIELYERVRRRQRV